MFTFDDAGSAWELFAIAVAATSAAVLSRNVRREVTPSGSD
jgi:hypothetical protein